MGSNLKWNSMHLSELLMMVSMTVFIFDVKYLSCFYLVFGFLQNLCKV